MLEFNLLFIYLLFCCYTSYSMGVYSVFKEKIIVLVKFSFTRLIQILLILMELKIRYSNTV